MLFPSQLHIYSVEGMFQMGIWLRSKNQGVCICLIKLIFRMEYILLKHNLAALMLLVEVDDEY